MKRIMRKATRDENGKVLIMVLILLLVGGLILTPMLGLMQTGLIAGQVYERKTAELYAADAGVEDAIWRIQNDKADFDEAGYYSYPDLEDGVAELWLMNGKSVDVKIHREVLEGSTKCHQLHGYEIISRARGDGSATTIQAYLTGAVEFADLSGLMDHLIMIKRNLSDEEVEALQKELKKLTLEFKDECYDECNDECFKADDCVPVWDYNDIPEGCVGCGAVYNYPDDVWPSADILRAYYWDDVRHEASYPYVALDVKDYPEIGPFRKDQGLTITNTGANGLTLQLDGTVYIKGDTIIGKTNADFTIDLRGNTIFVDSSTVGSKNALEVGGKCSILGPGAIIAVGDIKFAPGGVVGRDEEGNGGPVFVLSISGTTYMQPSASFYGAVAGHDYVYVQKGTGPTLTYPPGGIGEEFDFFPRLVEVDRTYDIRSWTIGPRAE